MINNNCFITSKLSTIGVLNYEILSTKEMSIVKYNRKHFLGYCDLGILCVVVPKYLELSYNIDNYGIILVLSTIDRKKEIYYISFRDYFKINLK